MSPWLAFLLGIVAASIGWAVETRKSYWADWSERRQRIAEQEGIYLPGWHCRFCRAFNGSARVPLSRCRVCQTER